MLGVSEHEFELKALVMRAGAARRLLYTW